MKSTFIANFKKYLDFAEIFHGLVPQQKFRKITLVSPKQPCKAVTNILKLDIVF